MNDKPLYVISIVSEMLNLHPQTIRQYERMGLLRPSRTEGNTRRYSDNDIKTLEYIIYLTKEMKINIAGVEMIMTMKEEIERLRLEIKRK